MGAKVTKIDVGGVVREVSSLKNDRSLGMFAATEAARLMQPYVPEREGILKASPLKENKPWLIVYNTPYARAQYYRGDFRHTKPTAMARWDKGLNKAALAAAIQGKLRRG